MLNLPGNCDGCGATFTIDHALGCHFDGLVTCQHNVTKCVMLLEICLLWFGVQCTMNQLFRRLLMMTTDSALKIDLAVCGVWQPHCYALWYSCS